MKMRARKRYNDAWQVGRELFRQQRRMSAMWLREIKLYPAESARHDDLIDALQYAQAWFMEGVEVPAHRCVRVDH